MPLLSHLGDAVWERYGERDMIPSDVAPLVRTNIEEALTYLTQPKPWLRESEALRHRALFLDLSSVLADFLGEAVDLALLAIADEPPNWWFKRLIQYWHRSGSTVLTLNYDTLIEAYADEVQVEVAGQNNRSEFRRLSPAVIYPPFLTNVNTRNGSVVTTTRFNSFQLLKLHGSTNWFYSGKQDAQGETIYYTMPQQFGDIFGQSESKERTQSLEAAGDKYPFLIPPIFDKAPLLTHETVRSLWRRGSNALSQAKRVIFLGYSLPPSDRTMIDFLRTSIEPNAKLEVVDLLASTFAHYETVLPFAKGRIEQKFSGKDAIAEFVNSLEAAQSS
jgi:hypothetical protein